MQACTKLISICIFFSFSFRTLVYFSLDLSLRPPTDVPFFFFMVGRLEAFPQDDAWILLLFGKEVEEDVGDMRKREKKKDGNDQA